MWIGGVGETNFLIIRSVEVQGVTHIVVPVGTHTATGKYKNKQINQGIRKLDRISILNYKKKKKQSM